jgi:hypothetical protein
MSAAPVKSHPTNSKRSNMDDNKVNTKVNKYVQKEDSVTDPRRARKQCGEKSHKITKN